MYLCTGNLETMSGAYVGLETKSLQLYKTVVFICAVVFYTLPCSRGIIKVSWKCEVSLATQPADSEATKPSLAGQYIPLTWSYISQTQSGSIPAPCRQGIW